MAKGKYIQVGVTAMRDPKTGDFLPAIPLYVKVEDVGEDAEKPMLADFVTLEPDGTFTVYDAKSAATARDKVYRLKKRQMQACNHIEIREV